MAKYILIHSYYRILYTTLKTDIFTCIQMNKFLEYMLNGKLRIISGKNTGGVIIIVVILFI